MTSQTERWQARPRLAFLLQAVIFVVPICLAWLAVRATRSAYWHPEGLGGSIAWVIQAMVVAAIVSYLASRVMKQLTPLSTLLKLSLIFPDNVPSRFGVALRSGTMNQLKKSEVALSGTVGEAAEEAIALVMKLGKHDRSTRGHVERVRAHAELIGRELNLPEAEIDRLRWGVLLHDIGKIVIPARILKKTGELYKHEEGILRNHPVDGARIVAPLESWLGEWTLAASEHHEQWDGGGYPAGLSGEDISLPGRITAVANFFDGMTAKRPGHKPLSPADARQQLVARSGTEFDPTIVRAFLRVGLQSNRSVGIFGWILELPALFRATPLLAPASSVVGVGLAAVAAVTSPGLQQAPPETVAFAITEEGNSDTVIGTTTTAPQPAQADEPSTIRSAPTTTPTVASSLPATTRRVPPSTTSTQKLVASTTIAPTTSSTIGSTTSTTSPTTSVVVAKPTTTQPATAQSTTSQTTIRTTTTNPPTTVPPSSQQTTTTALIPTTAQTPLAADAPIAVESPLAVPLTTTTVVVATTQSTTTSNPTTTTPTTNTTAPPPVPVGPTGTGFVILEPNAVPETLAPGSIESNEYMYLFAEQDGLVLKADLVVSAFEPGVPFNGDSPLSTVIPAETPVCVWFIHSDPAWLPSVEATINFGQTILGVTMTASELQQTSEFELPGVNYAYDGLGAPDTLTIDGSELFFQADHIPFLTDQIRVYTSC